MIDIEIDEYIKKISDINDKLNNLRPFDSFQLKTLKQWFKIWFVTHTNSIEWNTFTIDEVKLLIEDWITVWWKTIKEQIETENMSILTDKIRNFTNENTIFDKEFLLDLHFNLMKWTIEEIYLWKYRTKQVFISWEEWDILPHYSNIEELMNNYYSLLNIKDYTLENVAHIHYDFVKIHPFVDWNGRLARLLMNIALIKKGYFPIIISSSLRLEYIQTLKSSQNFESFYKFILWQIYENHKDYLRILWA